MKIRRRISAANRKSPVLGRPIEKGECIMSVGLVLEGGGTRGAYTSGVLDVFNENQIVFPVVYGISAGACNALSYISGQVGRNSAFFTIISRMTGI